MKFIFRFVGDPTGYVVEDVFDYMFRDRNSCWVEAKIGSTDETVLIDLCKAYIRELAK